MNLVTRLRRFAQRIGLCTLAIDSLVLFSAMQAMELLHEPFQMTENGVKKNSVLIVGSVLP